MRTEYRLYNRKLSSGKGGFPLTRPVKDIGARIKNEGITIKNLHALTYLAWLGTKTGRATLEETLGDYGIVHEAVHTLAFGEQASPCALDIDEIADFAQEITDRILAIPQTEFQSYFDIMSEA